MSDPRTEGYKRGLEGKGSSTSWGQALGDSIVNPSGSSQARREGYEQGCRDRALIQAQNKGKK